MKNPELHGYVIGQTSDGCEVVSGPCLQWSTATSTGTSPIPLARAQRSARIQDTLLLYSVQHSSRMHTRRPRITISIPYPLSIILHKVIETLGSPHLRAASRSYIVALAGTGFGRAASRAVVETQPSWTMSDTDIVEIDSKMVRATRAREREAWTQKLHLIFMKDYQSVCLSSCKM